MNLRLFIAMVLGLVIQLSQVPSCFGKGVPPACATSAMSCCGPAESCPCLKQTDPDRQPSPTIPAAMELKQIVLSALPDSEIAARDFDQAAGAGLLVEARPRGQIDHYAGVPLAVAFCRYLI